MSTKDENWIKKAITWAEKKGYKKVKANCEEYETPKSYTLVANEDTFIPDVTAARRGIRSYFEIALKTDDIQRRISKWKLMSQLAARNGGKLFLLAPRGHKAFAESVASQYRLNVEVVTLNA
jgi:hypothetical protein